MTALRRALPGVLPSVLPMAALAAALAGCVVWGRHYSESVMLTHGTAPFTGFWHPQLPAWALLPTAVLALVVIAQPLLSRLSWRAQLAVGTVAALLWSVSLALIDGPHALIRPLLSRAEYLHDVPRVHGLGQFLTTFIDHVDTNSAHSWTTHVAGHPPGALLTYVGLDRIALGGPWPAAILDIVGGALSVPAVLVTCRVLAGEDVARRALPFLVLTPAALWVATSADGFFLGVSAWCVALAAVAGQRHSWRVAVAAGVLCGALVMLSYGLVLIGLVVLAALIVAGHEPLLVVPVAAAALAVLLVVAVLGFSWLDGLSAATHRVQQGIGGRRPFGYWIVADVVLLGFAIGPAAVTALTRRLPRGITPLVLATGAALLIADLSGQSKGEVERIWLPFTPWLVIACCTLQAPRRWLMLQGVTAIGFALLVRSVW